MSTTSVLASQAAHLITGREGERTAARYLQELGYVILQQNVRIGSHDEIDIVAIDPEEDVVVFAEVKTRKNLSEDYRPDLNITKTKRWRMARAARGWMTQFTEEIGCRIDVICVAAGKVTGHYKDIEWE